MNVNEVCNNCGIINKNCLIKNHILYQLDKYLILDLNKIIIQYLQCNTCSNIIHKDIFCCDYMCNCKEYICGHFFLK